MYAIVDLETTGTYAGIQKITEVAVFISDGNQVIRQFHSLINPRTFIPDYIKSLTGITESMLKDAPLFEEIAAELHHLLKGHIFIAHNVNFDFNFLRAEFENCGLILQAKKLCTARLSRQIIPGLRSYGLGSICRALNITIEHRHRAGGDAAATVELFHQLLARDHNKTIPKTLKANKGTFVLPPNLSAERYLQTPDTPGVYYFLDRRGEVIYVGKAKNVRNRIASHFSGFSETQRKQGLVNNIYDLDWQICGNELIALLLECHEIKRLQPFFNQAQKRTNRNYGIFRYQDQAGYERLAYGPAKAQGQPVFLFGNASETRSFLNNLIKSHHLCPKLAGLQKSGGECFDYKINTCDGACRGEISTDIYNQRVGKAIQEQQEMLNQSFVILGEGRQRAEKSVVVVEDGRYLGFGYATDSQQLSGFEQAKNFISFHQDDRDIRRILKMHLNSQHDDQVHHFTPSSPSISERF